LQPYARLAYTAAPFTDEARASLPTIETSASVPDLEDVYTAVGLQRLRLHQTRQVCY
jgi:hypothetical protein